MSFVVDMTSRERNYFEKSVFAKRNVEAEMYLNANVSADLAVTSSTVSVTENFGDETVLSVNLSKSSAKTMSEGLDQLLKLNLKQSTPNTLHVNEIVTLQSNSPADMHNRRNSMNQKGVVMEEYEFPLIDDRISGLSSAMLSSSRVIATNVIEEILEGP